jgi:hypothetical protein
MVKAKRTVGRPPVGAKKEHLVQVTVSTEALERLDAWRATQIGIPSRAEAFRRMLDTATLKGKGGK